MGGEMMNDECGMMNKDGFEISNLESEIQTAFHSSFIIPHPSFPL
jgi:hypothetical protein